jgi:hypothetical protein
MLAEYFRSQGGGSPQGLDEQTEQALSRIPHTVQNGARLGDKVIPIGITTKTGRRVTRAIIKKTGEEVI